MPSSADKAPAKRLPSEARREQLVRAARTVAARSGYGHTSLDEVAERAGVTRNLLYHYFPRGRLDLFLAAVELGGEELARDWVTDPAIPLEQRLAANFARVVEHAMEPSEAWLLYRQALGSGEPEVEELAERQRSLVVAGISQNHFGTPDPPPYAALALRSYVVFAESALDQCRRHDLDSGVVTRMLTATLLAVVEAAREAG